MRLANLEILKNARCPPRSSDTKTLGDLTLEVGESADIPARSKHSSAVVIIDAVSTSPEVTSHWRGAKDPKDEGRPMPRPSALLLGLRFVRSVEERAGEGAGAD